MKKTKTTFKDILKNSPKPKIITDNTVLPYVFDLFWDAKTGEDLKWIPMKDFKELRLQLVKSGFDADEWFGRYK